MLWDAGREYADLQSAMPAGWAGGPQPRSSAERWPLQSSDSYRARSRADGHDLLGGPTVGFGRFALAAASDAAERRAHHRLR